MSFFTHRSILFLLVAFLPMVLRAQSPEHPFQGKKKVTNPSAQVVTYSPSLDQEALNSMKRAISTERARKLPATGINSFQPFHSNHLKAANLTSLKAINFEPDIEVPIFLEYENKQYTRSQLTSTEAVREATFVFFEQVRTLVPLREVRKELEISNIREDALGHFHVRVKQQYKGLEVWGKEAVVHLLPDGIQRMTGRLSASPILEDISPSLSPTEAIDLAKDLVSRITPYQQVDRKKLEWLGFEEPTTKLIIYPLEGTQAFHLAYEVEIHPNLLQHYTYILDAESGETLDYWNHTCSFMPPGTVSGQDLNGQSRSLNIFQESANSYVLLDVDKSMFKGNKNSPNLGEGVILTADMDNDASPDPNVESVRSANNQWHPISVSAHWNSSVSYDYFKNVHSWESINGQGGDILSIINVPDDDGKGLDNAYWNGKAMFYGNGRVAMSSLAGSLDVGGHEMSHGVIQATANLVYQDQPGALNESFADIFGVMIDREDYQLGEDIVNPQYFPSGALRSMSDPHNGGRNLNDNGYQPRHMSEIYTGQEDNGGVHINSGIPNFAFFKFAQSVGKAKAEQVYFRVLRDYLIRSSTFVDLRLAVVAAAGELYGNSEVNAAKSAFDQVGILAPSGNNDPGETPEGSVDPNVELPDNPGQDYILAVSEDPFDFEKIFIYTTNGENRVGISDFEPARPFSITDDGSVAVFVDIDDNMRFLTTDPNQNIREGIISTEPIWGNIAISKDGNRIAATLKEPDGKIHVFDISGNTTRSRVFPLFNPTTGSGGVSSGGVLYADALEWDYSGEAILYDALNEIKKNDGNDIEYWDVGFLRAWDNNTNDFSNGSIFKLFSSLDESESIGNARFAKNSPFRIVFDYVNEETNEIAQLTANIESGDIGTIWRNSQLGYPSYSKGDNRIVFNANDNFGDPVIAFVNLKADKLNADGGAFVLVEDAKWAYWYSVGERNVEVGIDEEVLSANGYTVFPNPAHDKLTIIRPPLGAETTHVQIFDLQGKQVLGTRMPIFEQQTTLSIQHLAKGMYILRLETEEKTISTRLVKQ